MIRRAEVSNYNHRFSRLVNANYTVQPADELLLVDCTNGNITITLPDALGALNQYILIKKIDSSANTVTIQGANTAQTIDSATTKNITAQWDIWELQACLDANNNPLWQSTSIPTTVAAGALPLSGGTVTGQTVVSVANAAAFAVGANGTTNPVLNIDSSVASVATGINIKGNAAGSGAAISVLSSGPNENLTIDAKGTGIVSIGSVSTGLIAIGRGVKNAFVFSSTVTGLGTTQNSTPTAAQLLTGVVTQTGATGAGTVTLPTGTNMSSAVAGVATGDSFDCVFANLGGGFNLTITGATGMTVVGNGVIPSGKNAILTFVNTGSNAWNCYVDVSA